MNHPSPKTEITVFLEQKIEKVDEEQHEMQNEKRLPRDENRSISIIWIGKNLLKKQKKFIAGKFDFSIWNCQWPSNNWNHPSKKLIIRIIFWLSSKVILGYGIVNE